MLTLHIGYLFFSWSFWILNVVISAIRRILSQNLSLYIGIYIYVKLTSVLSHDFLDVVPNNYVYDTINSLDQGHNLIVKYWQFAVYCKTKFLWFHNDFQNLFSLFLNCQNKNVMCVFTDSKMEICWVYFIICKIKGFSVNRLKILAILTTTFGLNRRGFKQVYRQTIYITNMH